MRVWPLFIVQLVIYFHPVSQYSVWQTMLLQESFKNHVPSESVEAAGTSGYVLRTICDAAAYVSSYNYLYKFRLDGV